jgi:hypothetical protein
MVPAGTKQPKKVLYMYNKILLIKVPYMQIILKRKEIKKYCDSELDQYRSSPRSKSFITQSGGLIKI